MMTLNFGATKMINRNKIRCKTHLKYVAKESCMIAGCTNEVVQAHHLLRSGGKGMGTKSCDGEAVPLCHVHHRQLHDSGNEYDWFQNHGWDYYAVLMLCKSLCHDSPSRKVKDANILQYNEW